MTVLPCFASYGCLTTVDNTLKCSGAFVLWVQNESTGGNLGRPGYSQGWDSPSVVPESDDSRPLHRGPQHMEAVPSWKDWPRPKHVKGQGRWIEKGPETVTAALGWVWGLPDTLFPGGFLMFWLWLETFDSDSFVES